MCLGLARLVKESHKHRPFPNCRGQQVNCLGLAGLINSHNHHPACRGLVCNIKAKLAPLLAGQKAEAWRTRGAAHMVHRQGRASPMRVSRDKFSRVPPVLHFS